MCGPPSSSVLGQWQQLQPPPPRNPQLRRPARPKSRRMGGPVNKVNNNNNNAAVVVVRPVETVEAAEETVEDLAEGQLLLQMGHPRLKIVVLCTKSTARKPFIVQM